MEMNEIKVGKIYHNGKGNLRAVLNTGYTTIYKTPSSTIDKTRIIAKACDFAAWAKGEVFTYETCGITDVSVVKCPDPYMLDVHETEVEMKLCGSCRSKREEEI